MSDKINKTDSVLLFFSDLRKDTGTPYGDPSTVEYNECAYGLTVPTRHSKEGMTYLLHRPL